MCEVAEKLISNTRLGLTPVPSGGGSDKTQTRDCQSGRQLRPAPARPDPDKGGDRGGGERSSAVSVCPISSSWLSR